jgi:hypothetical protein
MQHNDLRPDFALPRNANKTLGLFRNRRVTRRLAALDPARDHQEMVRLLGAYEFPWDTTRALELALFRTYASPSVSALLDRTGEFRNHGQKRYDDTAILVSEFLINGYDSEVGQRAIAHMNQLHGRYRIPNDDFLFVLSTFVFDPIDWINAYGWRRLTAPEEEAIFLFYREVGRRMHLTDLPESLATFRQWAQAYQRQHFTYTPSNRRVADATLRIVAGWLPRPLHGAVFPAINALLDDDLRRAFGYPTPPRWQQTGVRTAMTLRRLALRYVTFEASPRTVQNTRYRTYPQHDWVLENLGPKRGKGV